MSKTISFYLIFTIILLFEANSQTSDFGVWTHIGIDKKMGKWALEGKAELRSKEQAGQLDRWSFQGGASYNPIKSIKIGASYEYIYFNDTKYSDYQPRQRYIIYLQGKHEAGNLTLFLRERFQRTVKDESDRVQDDGSYDNYNINPEWAWRNRVKLAYNIPKCPVTPSISAESFYQLNNSDGNRFDKLRYSLSFSYRLSKQHEVEIYGIIDKEINVEIPECIYVIGFGYQFSF